MWELVTAIGVSPFDVLVPDVDAWLKDSMELSPCSRYLRVKVTRQEILVPDFDDEDDYDIEASAGKTLSKKILANRI